MLLRRALSVGSGRNIARQQQVRPFSLTIQAVFFEYESLNRLSDLKEDLEHATAVFKDEKQRVGSQQAINSEGHKPWDFKMHQSAKTVFDYLAREEIKAGLIMPKHPVEADVNRFMDLYASKFAAVVETEQVLLFPATQPLSEAAESIQLLPHQVLFVGGTELVATAKEARAFTCLLLREGEGEGGGDPNTIAAIQRKLRPDESVQELAEVVFAVEALNKEL